MSRTTRAAVVQTPGKPGLEAQRAGTNHPNSRKSAGAVSQVTAWGAGIRHSVTVKTGAGIMRPYIKAIEMVFGLIALWIGLVQLMAS